MSFSLMPLPSIFSPRPKTLWRVAMPAAFSLALALTAGQAQAQSIDTTGAWDGSQFISSFGLPNTATYGQTITAPAGQPAVLQAFDVRINSQSVALPFKFYVYEWDAVNNRATGPALYTSASETTQAVSQFQTYGVSGLNVSLVAGKQYVLFASVSETPGPNAATRWAAVTNTAYAGGNFVFFNNGTNTSLWTSSAWNTIGLDLAFTATIAAAPVAPSLAVASAGSGQATFTLDLPNSNNPPLQHYTLSCTPQGGGAAITTTGATSPITLSGLTNGTSYDCTATATNAMGTGPASALVSVTPVAALAIISLATQPVATVGMPFSLALQATGGVAPYSWSATGLPAGLSIDASTGKISGTPTTTGNASVVVTVADSRVPPATSPALSFVLAVNAAPITTAVPTLDAWALVLLGLLTAALGLNARRRTART